MPLIGLADWPVYEIFFPYLALISVLAHRWRDQDLIFFTIFLNHLLPRRDKRLSERDDLTLNVPLVIRTRVSRVAPDWGLRSSFYRLSFSM